MFKDKVRLPLLVASEACLLLASFSIWNCTTEDSYIGYRYAQNLAKGLGLVLNGGEKVEGYTNFLWVALLAGGSKLTSDPLLVSKILGTIFNGLALLACFYLCRLLSSEEAPVYGIALVATATGGTFVAGGVLGLEGALFAMLVCWLAVAYLYGLRAAQEPQRVWFALAALLAALLVMTRPDGMLAYLLLGLHAAMRFRRRPGALIALVVPFVAVYGPYFLWRWHYYGFFFPNTYYAKGGGSLTLFSRGTAGLVGFLNNESVGVLLAALIAAYIIFYPRVETTVLGLLILSRFIFELWSGGVTAGTDRFLPSALPLIWILAESLLLRWVGSIYFSRGNVRAAYWLAAAGALVISVQAAKFVSFRQNLEHAESGMESAHIPAGKWLRANAAPGASVAVGDIGAVGYWSGLRIIDTDGLADTTIAHSPGLYGGKGDARYVLSRKPDYIILRTKSCESQTADDVIMGLDRRIFATPDFHKGFDRLNCWDFFPNYHLLLFKRHTGS